MIGPIASLLLADLVFYFHKMGDVFWDFRTIYTAVKAQGQGLNPYDLAALQSVDPGVIFPFIYPPNALWILKPLSYVPYDFAAVADAMVTILALIAIYIGYGALCRIRPCRLLYLGAFALGLSAASISAFASGNIAVILHGVIALGLLAWMRGRTAPFYLAVLVASQFKPFFITFLILPCLLDWRRNWRGIAVSAGIFGGEYLALRAADPIDFGRFLTVAQTIYSPGSGNYGDGFAGVVMDLLGHFQKATGIDLPNAIGYGCYAVFAFIVIMASWKISIRAQGSSRSDSGVRALLVVSTLLCLPRLKDYDLPVLIVPLLVLAENIIMRWQNSLSATLILALLFMFPGGMRLGNIVADAVVTYWSFFAIFLVWCLACFALSQVSPIEESGTGGLERK
jgi:hypothetical protein